MLVDIYLANDYIDKAGIELKKALEIEPDNGYVQLAMAEYYRVTKKDKESMEMLRLAFKNPNINVDQKIRILAPYFSNIQDTVSLKTAIELSTYLTETHPTEAKAFAILGDFLYQNKELVKAKEAYEKTLQLDKKVFAVWQNLLFIEAEQADYNALLKTSNEALEYYPSNQLVFYMNAVAKSQTKDYQGAIVAYQQALNLTVNNKELEAQIYAGLGDAYHSVNDHAKSDASYQKALDIRPDDPYVLNNYAYYLSNRNERLDEALAMSKKSNELVKNNSSFLDTYAWIFFKLKRYEEAKIWIDAALLNGGEKSSTVTEHHGDILYHMNDVNAAVEEWKKASKLAEPSTILEKKIKDKKWYE
jgi:Tfp pilus assembly protein PilF